MSTEVIVKEKEKEVNLKKVYIGNIVEGNMGKINVEPMPLEKLKQMAQEVTKNVFKNTRLRRYWG